MHSLSHNKDRGRENKRPRKPGKDSWYRFSPSSNAVVVVTRGKATIFILHSPTVSFCNRVRREFGPFLFTSQIVSVYCSIRSDYKENSSANLGSELEKPREDGARKRTKFWKKMLSEGNCDKHARMKPYISASELFPVQCPWISHEVAILRSSVVP